MSILSIKDLKYTFADGTKALQGVSFDLKEGESLGIIGPNGAGKSTLLQILGGVFAAHEGEISLKEKNIPLKKVKVLRQNFGLVFQNPDDQLFCTTLYDDVAFGPSHQGVKGEELKLCVEEALNQVGIHHLAQRPPYSLSGGEKRSATLASILSMKPEILLMDESSANLDPKSRRRLLEIINSLDQAKIMVSHDLDFLLACCDRILIIDQGRVVSSGDCHEMLSNKELLEAHDLELPIGLQTCPVCSAKDD